MPRQLAANSRTATLNVKTAAGSGKTDLPRVARKNRSTTPFPSDPKVDDPPSIRAARSPRSTPKPGGPLRLAVRSLRSGGLGAGDEYLSDGLTQELISALSQVRGLRVISHASASDHPGPARTRAEIESDEGVDAILDGRVRREANRLVVAVRLTDAQTHENRWEQRIDRDLEQLLTIRGELSERAVDALGVDLRGPERDAFHHRPTSSLEAYDAYLKGIQGFRTLHISGPEGEKVVRDTPEYFDQAIRADPKFSAAYAYLANHLLALMGESVPMKAVVSRIRALAAKSLELTPDLADAHTARGNLAMQADRDWRRAGAELRRAIALNPSSSVAHLWYGNLLSFILQRHSEARKQLRTAIDLDPLWLLPRICLIWAEADAGDIASAVSDCEHTARLFPDNSAIRVSLAWCYAFAHRDREAFELVAPMVTPPAQAVFLNPIGVQAYLGRTESARAMLTDWEAGRLRGYVPRPNAAAFYALIGEGNVALGLLEREFREPEFCNWGDYQGPWFDSIREEPRFVSLLRRLNLPATLSRPLMPGAVHTNARSGRRRPSLHRNADRDSASPEPQWSPGDERPAE